MLMPLIAFALQAAPPSADELKRRFDKAHERIRVAEDAWFDCAERKARTMALSSESALDIGLISSASCVTEKRAFGDAILYLNYDNGAAYATEQAKTLGDGFEHDIAVAIAENIAKFRASHR